MPARSPTLILLWLALLLAPPVRGQDVLPDSARAGLEAVLEEIEDLGEAGTLAEWLAERAADPLDVNRADAEELAQIPALGPDRARALVRYRTRHGFFRRFEELLVVPGFSEDVLREARPYLLLGPAEASHRPRMRIEGLHRVGRRIETARGYRDAVSGYVGSPYRMYTRLRLRAADRLRAGLTLEKDPGEAFAWDPSTRTYGFDHVTGFAALHGLGRLETVLVGDFVATYGQGLVLWRSAAFGKGRDVVRPLLRAGRGILPYASTDENRFFRGAAMTLRLAANLHLSAFFSRRRLDARLLDPDTSATPFLIEAAEAASLAESGLHRTPTERAQKDAVRETLFGGALTLRRGRFSGGVVGYRSTFAPPFVPGAAPYERFRFAGRHASPTSLFASVDLDGAYVFGEVARADSGVVAGIGGVLLRPAPGTELILLARHYPRDFVSLHGFGFGERNGTTQNETGFYAGLALPAGRRWRLAGYFDLYRFPWIRFGVPRPSGGFEARLVVEYRPRAWLSGYVQARSETREAGRAHADAAGRRLDGLGRETRQSLRLHGDYRFGPRLRLRARLEASRYAAPGAADAFGLLLYQDLRWHPTARLRLDARLAFFDTDSFDARLFAYEDDLRYSFAVPAFSGRGQRAYLLLRWELGARLAVEAKVAATRFEDRRELGSGLDAIAGRRLRDVRAQILWKL